MSKIGVLGAGTWGIALARMLANNGHEITVWSALPEEITMLRETRRHKNLPGMIVPDSIALTVDLAEACIADVVLFAVPSAFVRSTAKRAAAYIHDQIIIDVAKGIEAESLMTMSEIIRQETGSRKVVALSGPTHAEEVAKDLPTTIVSACEDEQTAKAVQNIVMNQFFRVYTNHDVKGVELCGALKNIIALASGICTGLGYGDNARAALITRGMAEIQRLGIAMGCDPDTFYGLAGIGDLIVTATSVHSRNNKCGYLIGTGMPVDEATREVGMVVEGLNALPAAIKLAREYGVDMPITAAVDAAVSGQSVKELFSGLMNRDRKSEAVEYRRA